MCVFCMKERKEKEKVIKKKKKRKKKKQTPNYKELFPYRTHPHPN